MIPNHAADDEIQSYVSGETLTNETATHIGGCENCLAKAANYKLLAAGINQQPKPSFDFDVANIVLSKLPAPRKSAWRQNAFTYAIVFAAFSMLVILAWGMRNDLSVIFKTVAAGSLYVLIAFVVSVVLWLCYDMLGRYQKQMSALQ